jgi:hypothetical protein
MMGDQTGPHKANQYFRVVLGLVARETSLRDTSPASEDIIAAVPLRQNHFARFLVHRLPVHDQALPINHSDTNIFWIVDIVIDPPFASPGRLGGGVHSLHPASAAGADLAGKRSNADETILRNPRNPPETCAG